MRENRVKDRSGEVWLVAEGSSAEVVGLITSKNEQESGYGATVWNVLFLDGWCAGTTDTWGEPSDHDRTSFERQPGMKRIT